MIKQNYTAIIEFEIINPTVSTETLGSKLRLNKEGVFMGPEGTFRGYSLMNLLMYPFHYKPSRIVQQGKVLDVEKIFNEKP